MSDQAQNGMRPLRFDEASLIGALLRHVRDGEQLRRQLEYAQVSDMDDGGMGSLKFAGEEGRSQGSFLLEARYVDRDVRLNFPMA